MLDILNMRYPMYRFFYRGTLIKEKYIMGDRSSYSRQDTTSRSSREASNRSNRMDTYRRLSTARSETAGRGTSASGYDRAHSTDNVGQSSAGYQEGQNDGTAGQVGSSSGYNRAYNTYDAKKKCRRDTSRRRKICAIR
jgi:hypothetical protein